MSTTKFFDIVNMNATYLPRENMSRCRAFRAQGKQNLKAFQTYFTGITQNNLPTLVPLIILFLSPNPNLQILEMASTSVNLLTC